MAVSLDNDAWSCHLDGYTIFLLQLASGMLTAMIIYARGGSYPEQE